MGLIQTLGGLALRQVVGEGAEALVRILEDRISDHGQRVVRALQGASDRAWRALEVGLAGESLWSRLDRAEDRAFRDRVRSFLTGLAGPDLNGPEPFRQKCLRDLRAARQQGLLLGPLTAEDLARAVGTFGHYSDPLSVLQAERSAQSALVGELQQAGYRDLAWLLAQPAQPGQSLLVVAVRYFFRRQVETDEQLAQGLTFARLEDLSAAQEDGLRGLHEALEQHGGRLDAALDDVLSTLRQTHDAVLDLRGELERMGQRVDGQYRGLHEQVRQLLEQLQMHRRPVRPGDSLCIHNDREYDLVRSLLERYRQLPEAERRNAPALLNGLGQLQVAVGEFGGARDSFTQAARLTTDRAAQAEAHHNAYRAALEQRDFARALEELRRAVHLDAARFAPFPPDDYEPLAILGAGGFGVTFLCRHTVSGGQVAVKALSGEGLERDTGTVLREAAALEQLRHPAIVRLRHCGYADAARSRPYLVMEYFPGATLEDHVRRAGVVPLAQALPLAVQVADALHSAHRQGILHRDVKPANLLVSAEKGGWDLRLIDFGLALKQSLLGNSMKVTQRGNTVASASIAGTLEYAAPEQLGKLPGVRVGPPADVYGFARTLCFALFETAEPTFQDWQTLPRDLAELLGQCLARKPEQRPADFGTVLARLRHVQGERPPKAEPILLEVVEEEEEETPRPPRRRGEIDEKELIEVLRNFLPHDDLHVAPNIPARKLANACAACQVPEDERIVGLIDGTVFGSAKNALLFGLRGVYYRNDWSGKTPGTGSVPYREFADRTFVKESWSEVHLGHGQCFNRAGSQVASQTIADMLNAVKEELSSSRY